MSPQYSAVVVVATLGGVRSTCAAAPGVCTTSATARFREHHMYNIYKVPLGRNCYIIVDQFLRYATSI